MLPIEQTAIWTHSNLTVPTAVLCGVALVATAVSLGADTAGSDEIVVYRVDRKVKDFPTEDDFSTPEAAYATIYRRYAEGSINWRTVSCRRVNRGLPPGPEDRTPRPSDEQARRIRNTLIVEVRVYRGSYASVAARRQAKKPPIESRSFELEEGRWLNAGAGNVDTLEEAAKHFDRAVKRRQELESLQPRSSVEDPETALKPYVDYLRKAGAPPKQFLLDAINGHRLTVIGEIHHRPVYWALNSDVVKDPRFAKAAGIIYMELPMHAQGLVDKFLGADQLDTAPVIEMLRDNLWMGWPDQPMLDFFVTVWETNQTLDEDQRIRIVLVDMPRPWKKWIREGSLGTRIDRDKLMADNILAEIERSGGKRNSLFIVGYAHVENLRLAGRDAAIANCGRHLRESLGDNVYSVVQHGPVISNMGDVTGRTCLGLYDEAFAANGDRPVAFPLADSPFGRERYDLNADRCDSSMSLFEDAFDGYVYLGPLEEEVFSPLIPGFYTDQFVLELDQRFRLIRQRGLVDGLRLAACDARSFENWMSASWGRPRDWKYALGPVTAWHDGDNRETRARRRRHQLSPRHPEMIKETERQHQLAREHPEVIVAEAQKLLDGLRQADPGWLRGPECRYFAHHHFDVWIRWVTDRFAKDPIRSVELGAVRFGEKGRPAVPYTIVLESGDSLRGVLPFQYYAPARAWYGREGLDWHLDSE